MRGRCVCGCGQRGRQRHHVVYQQHIRERAPRGLVRLATGWVPAPWDVDARAGFTLEEWLEHRTLPALLKDPRNLADVAPGCHGAHHGGVRRLRCHMLPGSVFEFAVELFEAPAAYEYLARRYAGPDPRLDGLIAA